MQAISSVSLSKKQFRINDFKALANTYENAIVQKDGVYSGYGYVKLSHKVDTDRVEKLYRVGNRLFVYYNEGILYECATSGVKNPLQISSTPVITEVIYQGNQCVLIGSSSGDAYIYYNNAYEKIENAPKANCITFHNGRLFAAYLNTITFSAPFDLDNNTAVFLGGGTINVAPSSGAVVGFYKQDDKLYVICNYAVYRLTTNGESIDFKFEKLPMPSLDVLQGSVCSLFDVCLFISKEKIYELKGAKLTCVCSLPKMIKGCNYYDSAVMQEVYLFPVYKDSEIYIYAYDYFSGGESLIKADCLTVAKDGYTIDQSGVVKRIDLLGNIAAPIKYQSQPLNFDSLKKKTAFSLSAFVGNRCELTLTSEYGEVVLTLKKGYNRRRFNLDGEEFTLNIENAGLGFYLSDLRLDYVNRGNYAI